MPRGPVERLNFRLDLTCEALGPTPGNTLPMAMAADSLLEGFAAIGENIYLYEPSLSQHIPFDPASPSLIILCTWVGGATPRRINKYLAQYQIIFPSSSLLVITTGVLNTAFRPLRWVRANLKPARDAINRIVAREIGQIAASHATTNPRGILLHLFSHGGSSIACQLAMSMREEPDQGELFFQNLRVLILDCCPGDESLARMYAAARVSVPQTPVAQLLGRTVMYPALAVVNGVQRSGLVRGVKSLRDDLNRPSTFGVLPRRLYIYSKEDIMVGWTDVQSHLEDAQGRGYSVGQVLFEQGPHCGLIMQDSNRYWSAVKKFWAGENVWDGDCKSSQSMPSSTETESKIRSRL